jgi:hypothetical protein
MKQKKHVLFVLLLLFTLGTQAQENAVAIEGKLIKKTPALRDIKRKSVNGLIRIFGDDGKRIWPHGIVKPNEETAKKFNPVADSYQDQMVQKNLLIKEQIAAPNAGIILGIDGLATGTEPMDPSICVGKNHVIELVNNLPGTSMKIWEKDGTVAQGEIELQDISDFPGYGDPIALYDQWSDRYIVTEFIVKGDNNADENGMTIMVSETNDPTGAWYVYKWTVPENFTLDYPKWSVSTDGIYLHTNNFSQRTGYYTSSYFVVFNKDDMYAGNSRFRSLRITQNIGDGYATCNAQIQGNTVPSGGQLFVTENGSNQATVISCSVNWSNNTFTQSNAGNISLASFNETICSASNGACVRQPNNGSRVMTLSGRVMNQPIYRQFDGYAGLVFCFTVNAGSNTAGIRWVELRKNTGGSWTKYQEATWHPNNDHQFMPSMAYDRNGNIGLAYCTGSSSTYLSVKYTGRKNCDAKNQMTIPETTLRAGNASSTGNRWGDYSHLVADPDGNSLWMVAMYGKSGASGRKGTYISNFDLPQCGGGTTCPSTYDNSNNDTRSGAATIPFNTDVKGLINTSSDVDYYRFDITTAGTFTVSLSTLPADFDLKLYQGTTLLKTSENASTTSESITYSGSVGTYYAAVYGWDGAQSSTQCYTLKVQLGTATQPIASAANGLLKNKVAISPNPAKNYLELSVAPSSLPGEYQIFDMQSREIIRKTLSQTREKISVAALKPGTYILVFVDQDGVKSVHKFIKE